MTQKKKTEKTEKESPVASEKEHITLNKFVKYAIITGFFTAVAAAQTNPALLTDPWTFLTALFTSVGLAGHNWIKHNMDKIPFL